jgi:DNA-binding transcriptional LysR family regulator
MELRHLRYFVALADELHFGRAAQRLHIVQPALSKQIAALERELGVLLFDRTNRTVSITPAGRVFHAEVRTILHRIEKASDAARQTARGELGGLEIGFIEPAMWSILPATLVEHRRRFPQVRFRMWQGSSAEQLQRLLDGSLDVAFVRMPLHESSLVFEPVTREQFLVTLPDDHRFASAELVDLAELADEPFVLVPRRAEPGYFDQSIALCRSHGFSPRIVEEGNGPSAICAMVASGLGISLSPQSIRNVPWRGVRFAALAPPPAGAAPEAELALARRREEPAPVLIAYLETVADIVAGSGYDRGLSHRPPTAIGAAPAPG